MVRSPMAAYVFPLCYSTVLWFLFRMRPLFVFRSLCACSLLRRNVYRKGDVWTWLFLHPCLVSLYAFHP